MAGDTDIEAHADPDAVRAALRHMPMPVTVLLVHDGTETRGMTATSVMPVSLAPPLLAVGVGHARWAHDVLVEGAPCSVALLNAGHEHIADHFGGSARRERGVQPVRLARTRSGLPTVDEAVITFGCTVEHRYPAGDHTIVVLRVVDVEHAGEEDGCDPMLWHAGEAAYLDRR